MQIHLVKTRLANAIVVEYPDRLFVVDVATGSHEHVMGYVEHEIGRPVDDIELVTCTHDDRDHMGGIKDLATRSHAALAMPMASGNTLNKWINDPFGGMTRASTMFREAMRPRSRQMYVNAERDEAASKLPRSGGMEAPIDLSDKKVLRLKGSQPLPGFDDWQVLHTPGHSWDSCCFFHELSGSLISGDTLLASRKQNRVVLPAIYANRLHFSRSLTELQSLEIKAVFPGHGPAILGNSPLQDLHAGAL